MSERIEIETNEALIAKAKRIKENECRWRNGDPIVNVKDFKMKFMRMSWTESSISFIDADDDTDKEKMVKRMMREGKSVKILPLIITSNIYILVVLAAISKMLSTLIEKVQTDIDEIGIDFLVGKGLIEYSGFIRKPFDENYKPIIPDFYEGNLTTVLEINFLELKSLLNILIASLDIKGVDFRKIIKKVHHTDLEDYCRETIKPAEGIEQTIVEWTSQRRRGLSDADEDERRIKEVTLNKQYNITAKLLKILTSHLQPLQPTDNKSRDKIILIVATPVEEAIKKFFAEKTDELKLDKKRLDDIMFVSYTNPTAKEDPEVLVKSIP
jgi:hypothetical protein